MPDQETLPQESTENQTSETSKTEEKGKTRQMSFTVTDDGLIRADFGEGIEPRYVNPALLPETITSAAVTEGIISRLRGYTSALESTDRTPAALAERIDLGIKNLTAGIWKIERGGAGSTEYSLEIEAAHLFRIMRDKAAGKTYEGTLAETAENFNKLTEDQKKQLKALPRYQLAMVEVKERKAAEKRKKLEESIRASEGPEAVF